MKEYLDKQRLIEAIEGSILPVLPMTTGANAAGGVVDAIREIPPEFVVEEDADPIWIAAAKVTRSKIAADASAFAEGLESQRDSTEGIVDLARIDAAARAVRKLADAIRDGG